MVVRSDTRRDEAMRKAGVNDNRCKQASFREERSERGLVENSLLHDNKRLRVKSEDFLETHSSRP